jgi:hypothetical protein
MDYSQGTQLIHATWILDPIHGSVDYHQRSQPIHGFMDPMQSIVDQLYAGIPANPWIHGL